MLKEKDTEKLILQSLSFYRGGFVCSIELSGKPIRKGARIVGIAPFMSPFYRRGMSDILFFYKGAVFAFEVKTPAEYRWISKNYERLKKTPLTMLKAKKDMHIKEQILFLQGINKAGGKGVFVYELRQVEEEIKLYFKKKDE